MPRSARAAWPLAAATALTLLLPLPPAAHAASPWRDHHPDQTADCALPGRTGWTDEGHDTDYAQFQRPLGTIRVAMLFVDFPDAPATESTATDAAGLLPAADWMREESYGKVQLNITPVDRWLRMPQDSTSYGFQRGITFAQHELYVGQAIAAADPDVDFSQYDMVYIVPTKNASAVTFSPTYLYDPNTTGIVADGKRVKWAVTFGQDMWHWGFKVANHETSHTFGLPDLYAFTGTDYHRYVGGWDLMGNISGAAPQHLAWESWKFGWTTDDQVACQASRGTSTVQLTAVELTGGTKMAVVRTGPTTAYVAESRRAIGADSAACSSGVLIYKVDSSTQTGYGPVQIMDAKPDATPQAPCTPLDDAAYQPGQSFNDSAAGVRIDVLSAGSTGDVVRVTRGRR